MKNRRKIIRYAVYAVLAAALAAALVYMALLDEVQPGPFVPCIFHAATGLYCPGCGMFRLIYHLVHLRIGTAFACNPLGFIVLPCLSAAWVMQRFPRGRSLVSRIDRLTVTRSLLWAIAAFWVLRNIPVFPFTLLAPLGALA
ncbi:MAG: DUF2752 domain-containing protein [Bacillota bacterium]